MNEEGRFSSSVRARLIQSDETLLWIQQRLDGLTIPTLPDNKRIQLSGACFHVAMEHSQAVVTLTHAGLCGSARALIRPLFEAYIRGLWLKLAASERQVDDAGNDRFPNDVVQLITGIESHLSHTGLSELKGNTWKRMCSLTHTGFQQMGARLTSSGLGYGTTDDEIMEALIWADWIGLMTVVAFAHLADDAGLLNVALERVQQA